MDYELPQCCDEHHYGAKAAGEEHDRIMTEVVGPLVEILDEMTKDSEEVLRCLLLSTSREQHGIPREEIVIRNPLIEAALIGLHGQARAALAAAREQMGKP